jgi:hypothetical protein
MNSCGVNYSFLSVVWLWSIARECDCIHHYYWYSALIVTDTIKFDTHFLPNAHSTFEHPTLPMLLIPSPQSFSSTLALWPQYLASVAQALSLF